MNFVTKIYSTTFSRKNQLLILKCQAISRFIPYFCQLWKILYVSRHMMPIETFIYSIYKICNGRTMRTALNDPFRTFFGTLANQYRLDIIGALRKKEMSVTEICSATGFKQPTVSHNLKRLQHCGFVFMEQQGKEHVFSLNKKTIKPVLEMMHSHMSQYCSKICPAVKK